MNLHTNLINNDASLSGGEESSRLKGKTIIITGASGGIGFCLAKLCLEHGANVGGCYYKSISRLLPLIEQYPRSFEAIKFNVCSVKSVGRGLGAYLEKAAICDVLIHCAGVGGNPQFLIHGDTLLARHVIEVNLMGCLIVSQLVLKFMVRQRSGTILNIGSISSISPTPGVSAYAASKGGVESLTRSVAVEYGRRGIRSICLRLGPVNTRMIETLPDEAKLQLARRMPGGQILQPEFVATQILDCLQTNFPGVSNGETLDFAGGYLGEQFTADRTARL